MCQIEDKAAQNEKIVSRGEWSQKRELLSL
jgi:hypothetical protein